MPDNRDDEGYFQYDTSVWRYLILFGTAVAIAATFCEMIK